MGNKPTYDNAFNDLLNSVFSIPAKKSRVDCNSRTYRYTVKGFTFFIEKEGSKWVGWFEDNPGSETIERRKSDCLSTMTMLAMFRHEDEQEEV